MGGKLLAFEGSCFAGMDCAVDDYEIRLSAIFFSCGKEKARFKGPVLLISG